MRASYFSVGLILLSAHIALAQPFAVGVEGGLQTTADVSGTLNPESKRYIVGPKVEVRLPLHFSFEVDALYRHIGFTGSAYTCCGSSITRERDHSWEFPMIVKYHLPSVARLHPFAGVGYAVRTVSGSDVSAGRVENIATGVFTYYSNVHSNVSYPVTHGLVVSGGVEFRAPHLMITPEVRYTHWNQPFLNEFGGDGSFQFQSPQNELYVLVGLAWH